MTMTSPPLAVRTIFKKSLERILEQKEPGLGPGLDPEDILDEFDVLFESVSEHEKTPRPLRLSYGWGGRDPFVRKYLWQYLTRAEIRITPDRDQDGIRNLFRLLDGAALTRTGLDRGLNLKIGEIFHNFWTTLGPDRPGLKWETLYRAERAANVYGLAAASVFTWLQREGYLPAAGGNKRKDSRLPPGHVPGVTHPFCLRYLNQPIMAHGRWAIQYEVNLKNTHPFTDQARQRCVAVNGQFSGNIESRLRTYLTRVVGVRLESSNSTEYLVQLWNHYFETFFEEQNKNRIIRNQVLLSLDDLAVGSQAVDYSVNHKLQGKTGSELEEMAFIQALKVMSREGGQVAAAGMNSAFPNLLYIGAHNRPVFIVQRLDTAEYMLVSDINAALGLFPQALIQEKARKLRRLKASAARRSRDFEPGTESGMQKQALQAAEEAILNTFRVRVYPLEGEELFARIQTTVGEQGVIRELSIMNFEREPVWELEPFLTRLSPIQVKKDRDKTFYETHLKEIPDRLTFLLETYSPKDRGDGLPEFDLNHRLFFRRFGRDLSKLRRVFLIGIGASYNMAAIAKNFFQDPKKARVLKAHFQLAGLMISSPLNSEELAQSVQETAALNPGYKTGLFIGPVPRNGVAWVSSFEHHGTRIMEWYQFGACAHGPVVTVDDQVENKFVCLERRTSLIEDYGKETVKAWEEKYLQGRDVDHFVQDPGLPEEQEIVSPFFARGRWYLPELRQDYDPGNDNLIILDASSERFLGQALDEMSAFGCRHPRLVIISQESFFKNGSLAFIRHLPVSHLLLLPDPVGAKGGEPVSDFLLPFVISSLGVAMAAWGE